MITRRAGRAGVLTALVSLAACGGDAGSGPDDDAEPLDPRFRDDMRAFVKSIADYARSADPDFVVIPQNGQELVTMTGDPAGSTAGTYLAAIDGVGREDLFFGYERDGAPTPFAVTEEIKALLHIARSAGAVILVTDYISTPAGADESHARNTAEGFLSFAAPSRDLDVIPTYPPAPRGVNPGPVDRLGDARNFLYLLDPSRFPDKASYLAAMDGTEYDVLIIDAFFGGDDALSAADVEGLKSKPSGARRLVIAYMSIGEAENYRYYWQTGWRPGSPGFVAAENPDFAGNYKVRYWDPEWQRVIVGGPGSYTQRLLDAGFDGTYLDIIDAFEFFEGDGV